MAIVKMKHLRLVAMAENRDTLLRLLQRMGCVEIDEPSVDEGDPAWAGLTRAGAGSLSQSRERQSAVERALAVLKRCAPAKERLLRPQPGMTEKELFDEHTAQDALRTAEEINNLDRRLSTIHAEEAKLLAQKGALAPWLNLDLPPGRQSTEQVLLQLGTLPANVPFAQAEGSVLAAGDLSQLTLVSADREQQYLLLVCHVSQSEAVLQALKELGWSRANLRDWSGTAAENTARLERELEELAREAGELEEKLAGMGGCRADLQRLADRTAAEVSREECRSHLMDTGRTFYLEGWVPAESWPDLQKAISPYPCAWEVSDPAQEEYPNVPVKLKNNWFTRPLNMVTEMYSLPAYGTVDPNPLMAPFFVLFYGIMMADMGYGLLMFLMGCLLRFRQEGQGHPGPHGGADAPVRRQHLVMGAVTGGFLGDFPSQLAKVINPESTFALPALFTPLDDTIMILLGAMALGFVQIVTGMAVSFAQKLRRGQIMDAVWEEVTWWLVFLGAALAALGVTRLVLIAACAMVLAGPIVTGKGFGRITGVFGSLYNHVTGYFGDILSYSRLMALMLSGSVIAQVFNTLGAIPGNVVVFFIVSMAGNALNFALNLLGCYVHDLRLQCLEFFKNFYQDGGKPFRPLAVDTKYVDIQKD